MFHYTTFLHHGPNSVRETQSLAFALSIVLTATSNNTLYFIILSITFVNRDTIIKILIAFSNRDTLVLTVFYSAIYIRIPRHSLLESLLLSLPSVLFGVKIATACGWVSLYPTSALKLFFCRLSYKEISRCENTKCENDLSRYTH